MYIDKNYDNDVDNQNETFCISALALLIRRNTKPFIAVNSMIFQKLTIPTVGVIVIPSYTHSPNGFNFFIDTNFCVSLNLMSVSGA